MPVSKNRVEVIETLFKPKAGLKVLRGMDPEGRVYQGDLVRTLGLSNKTVIAQLRKMVDLGIVREHSEKIVRRRSTFWAKSYELTEAGRWIYYFVVEERRLSRRRMRRLAEKLLQLYAAGSMSLCRSFGLSPEGVHSNLDLAWMKQALLAEERKRASAVVFGTAAVDLVLHLSGKPGFERSYVPDAVERPGGAGANVAVGLSKLGVRTALAAKIGADGNGRRSVEDLLREKVVCRNLVVSEEHITPISVVALSRAQGKHVFYVDGPNAALSIEPEEVDWELLRRAGAAVLCECFIEVCRAVVDRARQWGTRVFYRPSFPYVVSAPDDVAEVARLCDVVILGSEEANLLSKRGHRPQLSVSEGRPHQRPQGLHDLRRRG